MTRKFFSGNTLDQAVMMAARHYEVEPDELAYRQIEKKHGFLRTRKAVMIAVDPDRPRREPEVTTGTGPRQEAEPAPAGAPFQEPVAVDPPVEEEVVADGSQAPREDEWAPESEPATAAPDEAATEPHAPREAVPVAEPRAEGSRMSEPDEELLGAAQDAARTLMRFAGIDAEASSRSGGERVEVEIEGPDSSLLVVEGGKGLLAIQHLLPRMLRGLTGRSSFVRVDSEGFHRKRRERLEALAVKEAEAASRSGRPRTLPPMAPDERRIVHLALKDSPAVDTESRGRGLHKQVVVRPVAGDGGTDDIEARHGF